MDPKPVDRAQKEDPMKRALIAVVVLLALFLPRPSRAAAYPERPIELIIPFGVGGGSDTAARAIVPALEKVLKTKIVITNMPGGGTKGMLHVGQQPADGYTLFAITTSHFIDAVKPRTRVNLLDDFVPVARYQLDTTAVLVGAKTRFNNLKELIEFGTKNPR